MATKLIGTNASETLTTSSSTDHLIFGKGGDDTLRGGSGDDRIFGGNGNDVLELSGGRDLLYGGKGDDTYLYRSFSGDAFVIPIEEEGGGFDTIRIQTNFISFTISLNIEQVLIEANIDFFWGNEQANTIDASSRSNGMTIFADGGDDIIKGTRGHDLIFGGSGADTMEGGDGFDRYYIDNINDVVIENAAHGDYDSVIASVNYTLGDGVESLSLKESARRGTGNDDSNYLGGNGARNILSGMDGNDNIFGRGGRDKLFGGAGDDVLQGGRGRDVLFGGDGDDIFVFLDTKDTGKRLKQADVIKDFAVGDLIDLSAIDASNARNGLQEFAFIGDAVFSGSAGELRFEDNVLAADRNGDGVADFFIKVTGTLGEIEDALLL